jgi:hypothetical protein
MGPNSWYGSVFEFLLKQCSPLVFPSPWNFLPTGVDCYGPIVNPEQTLALLRENFSDQRLMRAGVLEHTPAGELRLSLELSNPLGAVVALRRRPQQRPYLLLTAGGCLARSHFPIQAALKDFWTAEKVLHRRMLFASPCIMDVVLLRSLGFPATLATGILQRSHDELRWLDAQFGYEDFASIPERKQPSASAVTTEKDKKKKSPAFFFQIKPTLALLGSSLLNNSPHPSPVFSSCVAHLKDARRHFGLAFPGVMAWRMPPHHFENLQYRLTFQETSLVRELLWESAETLFDFEDMHQGHDSEILNSPGLGYVKAKADLLVAFADNRFHENISNNVRNAIRVYETAVQDELIKPLQEWALASNDPAIRAAGMELATVCALLHQISPLLHDLLARNLENVGGTLGDVDPSKVLSQYLLLTGRFGSLLRDLWQWRYG